MKLPKVTHPAQFSFMLTLCEIRKTTFLLFWVAVLSSSPFAQVQVPPQVSLEFQDHLDQEEHLGTRAIEETEVDAFLFLFTPNPPCG